MQLSNAAIQEFKGIYKAEFGEDLSDSEAEACALRLLRVYAILLRTDASESSRFDDFGHATVPSSDH